MIMANIVLVGVVCGAFMVFGDCAIHVDVTPPVINIGHTDRLDVTCSVQKGDFPNSLFSITLSHSPAEDDPKFTYLASINNCDGQVRKISFEAKTAIGVVNISGDSYLTLTWTRPTFKRSGVYKCDVIAMDVQGKPVSISQAVSVGASNDDMDAFVEMFDNFTDLYDYSIRTLKCMCENKTQEINVIRSDTLKLEKSIYHLDETINDKYLTLKSEFNVSVSDLKFSLNTTEQSFSNQVNQINSLYNELHSSVKENGIRLNISVNDLLDKQRVLTVELNEVRRNSSENLRVLAENINILTKKLDKLDQTTEQSESYQKGQDAINLRLQNLINTLLSNQATLLKMESGSFTCGQYAKNFPLALNSEGAKGEDTAITFASAFPRPPKIILAAVGWDLYSGANHRLWLQRLNVTTTGFVARCGTWADTVIYSVSVEWIALSTSSD